MKSIICFALTTALTFSGGVAGNAVTPSVSGIVTKVSSAGSKTDFTVNGHVYEANVSTKSNRPAAQWQPGQSVTLFIAADGHTVVMILAPISTATHP